MGIAHKEFANLRRNDIQIIQFSWQMSVQIPPNLKMKFNKNSIIVIYFYTSCENTTKNILFLYSLYRLTDI